MVVTLPPVRAVDVYALFTDVTPVTVTVAADGRYAEWHTTAEEVRRSRTLWRQMHLVNWNSVPEALRREGLDNMLVAYRAVLMSPRQWDRMTAVDWDLVRFDSLLDASRQEIHSQAQLAVTLEDSLASRLAVQLENAREAGAALDLAAVQRDADSARTRYDELEQRRTSPQLLLLSVPDDVRVLSAASVPSSPKAGLDTRWVVTSLTVLLVGRIALALTGRRRL